jgi:CRISPR-associated protein Csm3
VIDRLIGKAGNLRFTERVPAGSEFNLDMVYSIYSDNDLSNLRTVFEAMSLLEDNYLGGSGSRGYGKVEYKGIQVIVKTKEDYINGVEKKELLKIKIEINVETKEKFTINEILQHFDTLKNACSKHE